MAITSGGTQSWADTANANTWNSFGTWLRETYGDNALVYLMTKYRDQTDYNVLFQDALFKQWQTLGSPAPSAALTSELFTANPELQRFIENGDWNSVYYYLSKPGAGTLTGITTEDTTATTTKEYGIPDESWIVNIGGYIWYYPKFADGTIDYASSYMLTEKPITAMTDYEIAQIQNYTNNLLETARQFDLSNAEEKRQFDITTAESKRQFDLQMGFSQEQLAYQKEYDAAQLAEQQRQTSAQLHAQPGNWIQAYSYDTKGQLPAAPSWLPEYAPGVGTSAITPVATKTPSGQDYSSMPWGQREMLGGYAAYANVPGSPQNVTEINERVQSMLPQNVKARAWQPISQV